MKLIRVAPSALITVILFSCAVPPSRPKGWRTLNLDNGLIKVQVAPDIGGRIIQYSLGDFKFFWVNDHLIDATPPESGLGPDGSWLNYGGEKLWPAPQGSWEGQPSRTSSSLWWPGFLPSADGTW